MPRIAAMGTSGKKDGLSAKHRRFADEYLVDLNAAAAYRRVGYKAKSDHVAAVSASKMLANPDITAYVAARQAVLANKLGITQEKVLSEYAKLAFSDPRKVAEWGPGGVKLKHSTELTDDAAACVSEVSIKPTEHGIELKFKLHDKKGALDSIAKHLGMFADERNSAVRDLADELRKARARIQADDPGGEE